MVWIKRKKGKYLLIFENLTNLLLIKDIGMIPYIFQRIVDFKSSILTYKDVNNYPYLKEFCNGLELEFLKRKKWLNKINRYERPIISYLIKNSKNIDILELFHLTNQALLYAFLYKLLNRNGFVYIKLDEWFYIKYHNKIRPNNYPYFRYNERLNSLNQIKNKIRNIVGRKVSKYAIKKLNLLSIETKALFDEIKDYPRIKNKVIYLPNGIDDIQVKDLGIKRLSFSEKKNIILTVGTIGWEPKGHQILLNALTKINDLKNWQFYLIGQIRPEFQEVIRNFYKDNPSLKDKVFFTGGIYDRRKLLEYYQKSKIFCFPSIMESFGVVLVEAGYFGNYIVSSDIPSARDITKNGTLGKLFKASDSDELANILDYLMNHEEIIRDNCPKIQDHIDNNFLWSIIVSKLYREIIKRRKLKI
ncbi:MAG: glycosyltransferase family 4 protein [Promethearchaeota archaeon]